MRYIKLIKNATHKTIKEKQFLDFAAIIPCNDHSLDLMRFSIFFVHKFLLFILYRKSK